MNDSRKLWRGLALPLTAAFGVSALAACGTDDATNGDDLRRNDQYIAALQGFGSCDELDDYLTDLAAEAFAESYAYDYYGMGRGGVDLAAGGDFEMEDGAPTAAPGGDANADDGGGESAGAPTDFTTTNTQEEGIDEPDLVKTNGQHTFVLNGQMLHVLDTFPVEDTHEIATLTLEGWGENMFLVGDKVVTFRSISTGEYSYGWDDDFGGGVPEPDFDREDSDSSAGSGGVPEPGFDGEDSDPSEDFGDEEPSEDGPGVPEPAPEPGDDAPRDDDDSDSDAPLPSPEPRPEPIADPLDDGEWFQGTRVTVIDVADPSAPTIERRFDIEGSYTSARLVDGIVYLVANASPDNGVASYALYDELYSLDLPELDYDASEGQRLVARTLAYNAARPIIADWVASGGREALLPDLRTTDGRGELFDCTDLMHPEARSGFSVLSVIGFDPTSDADPSGAGVLADGWQVYGSATALYIAQDSRWWTWFDRDAAYAETQIHRFLLADGNPGYTASGSVPGWLLNQFSMSEHNGDLRVATTDSTNWGWGGGDGVDVAISEPVVVGEMEPSGSSTGSAGGAPSAGGSSDGAEPEEGAGAAPESDGAAPEDGAGAPPEGDRKQNITRLAPEEEGDANNVFVLRQDGRSLDIISGIRGIAPTEQIYAVRFKGDMGYVVTFRQTDPLYTIDLSDPEAPTVEGELHIPGFSTYLHPFGEGYLIGVGRDGDEFGNISDLQLQLFDVRDPSNPTRTHQEVLSTDSEGGWGWSSSEAEHDHRAFTFYAAQNLLAIPVTLESSNWEDGAYSHFSGIIVFRVSAENGFEEVGRVSHSILPYDRYCTSGVEDAELEIACESWEFPWWVNMRRSGFIDDYLLAYSDQGVTASAIADLDEILSVVAYE